LEQAEALALEHHPSLKELEENIKQADLLINRAWAILLPRLSLSAQLTRNDQEISFDMPDFEGLIRAAVAESQGLQPPPPGSGNSTIIQEEWGQRYGFTARIPLFNAQAFSLLENAKDNLSATRLQRAQQEQNLRFAVSVAYYGLCSNQEALEVTAADLKRAQLQLKMAQKRRDVGVGLRIEVLEAEFSLSQARRAQSDAKDSLRLAQIALSYLIHSPPPFEVQSPPRPELPQGDLRGLQEEAERERPDLKAFRLQQKIVSRDREHTLSRFLPTFDLTYNYSWDSAAGFGGEQGSWRLIFGGEWSLFEGGDRLAVLESQKSELRQIAQRYSGQLRTLQERVERELLEIQKWERSLKLREQQAKLAEESQHLVQEQYKRGLAKGLDLQELNQRLRQAHLAVILARLQRDVSLLKLYKTLGRLN